MLKIIKKDGYRDIDVQEGLLSEIIKRTLPPEAKMLLGPSIRG